MSPLESKLDHLRREMNARRSSRRAVLGRAVALGTSIPAISAFARSESASAGALLQTGSNTVTVALAVDVSTLDPFQMFSKNETSVADHVIESLTFRAPDESVKPLLATSWTRESNNLSWVFKLQQGVKFSTGEPFNASAAKFSIDILNQRNKDGKPLGNATVAVPSAEITQVDVVDDATIRITTKQPKALLDLYLAAWPMVSPTFYGGTDESKTADQMVGTGRYVVAERVHDDHVTLTANPNYWGTKPTVQRIVFRVVPEVSTQIAELQTGGVDIVPGLPIDQAQLLLNQQNVKVATIEGGRRVFVGISTNGPAPLQDKRVRQALNYAVDWDSINKGLFLGRSKRMSYVFNPPNADTSIQPYPFDQQKAKDLMTQAGYANGFELDAFATPTGRWIDDLQLSQVLLQQFEKVGVKFKNGLQTYEWGVYKDKLLKYDLPGLFLQASGGEFEAAGEAADFTFTSPSDFYRWNNPTYEQLWQQLQGELDPTKRTAIAMQMQQVIHDDCPIVFLYIQLDTYGVSSRVNWQPRMDELIHLWDVTAS